MTQRPMNWKLFGALSLIGLLLILISGQTAHAAPSSRYVVVSRHFACVDPKDLAAMYTFIGEKDFDEANSYFASHDCVWLEKGESVFLEDVALLHGRSCVRQHGQDKCVWVDMMAITPDNSPEKTAPVDKPEPGIFKQLSAPDARACEAVAAKIADKSGVVFDTPMSGTMISMVKERPRGDDDDDNWSAQLICKGGRSPAYTFWTLSPEHPTDEWFRFVAQSASALTDDPAPKVYAAATACYQRAKRAPDTYADLSSGKPSVKCSLDGDNLELFIAKH
jgi:hypothetical protein